MPSQNQAPMLEIALACARRGDFKGMAEVCRGILSADPEQPDALHCMGLLHRRTGSLASAVDCHERSVRGRPDNAEYRNALGVAYRAADRLADAIEAFEGAMRIDPGFVDAYVNAGQAHFSRGDFRTAVARFRDAVERQPRRPLLHVALGRGLAAQGDRRAAEASLQRALALDGPHGPAYAALGDLRFAAGDTAGALAAFKDGIASDPNEPGNYLRIAPLLTKLDRADSAIELLQQAIRHVPGIHALHVALARMLMRRGEWATAWAEYERRLAMPPLNRERRRAVQPLWDGTMSPGLKLCVHFEPDVAESLALLRYLEPLLRAGVEPVLRCPRLMRKMLDPLSAHMRVCATDEPLPPFDRQVWLGSLPLLLERPDPSELPAAPPGMEAHRKSARWRARCEDLPRPLIGLHWRSPAGWRPFADMRTLLAAFASFAGGLIALQDRTAAPDIAAEGMLERVVHVGAELPNEGDIATEIAQAAAQCNLVVSVDSPVAITAALVGCPTLLLVDGGETFPWPLDRLETAWFPNLAVLHRSPTDDDAAYVDRIQRAVESFAGETAAGI